MTDSTPSYPANVQDHGPAQVTGFADGVLTLTSDRAHPPGRPLTLVAQLPGVQLQLSAKTIGSKRRDDGQFTVRIRLSSLRREQRAALEHAFGSSGETAG